jgi:hypothetical protein
MRMVADDLPDDREWLCVATRDLATVFREAT